MNHETLSFADLAVILPDGSVFSDDAKILLSGDYVDLDQFIDAARRQGSNTFYEVIGHPRDGLCVLAIATLAHARKWRIPLAAAHASLRDDSLVICRISPTLVRGRLKSFCKAFGLTDAVARTVIALYDTCDVRAAAQQAAISYHTAREYLKQARAAICAPNLQQLITWAAIGSLAINPNDESDDILSFLFSLTDRQLQVAAMIADGAS